MRVLAFLLTFLPHVAFAGAQIYEPLADSVRVRLSRMVSDKAPATMHFRQPADGQRWLEEMDKRLEKRIPDRQQRLELLRSVQYEATRARLDPQLVLGVIEVESGFRKYAVSRAGARGYMQVMPFWVKLIGQPSHNLFHLRTNLAFGCVILRHSWISRKVTTGARSGATTAASASPAIPSSCSRRGAGAGSTTGRPHDRAASRAQPAGGELALRLHAARARAGRARAPARVHRPGAPGLVLRRHARRAPHRLDQLRALARLRAHLLACRPRPRRHGAHRAQPRAHRHQRRARGAGVRRRVGAVPALSRRPRRVRPAVDPRAPCALGLAARGRRAGERDRRGRAPDAGAAARLAAARPRHARDALSAGALPRLELHRAG